MARGIFKIRNDSGSPYTLAELAGAVIPTDGELDLMDPELPVFYDSWSAVQNLKTMIACQVYADLQSGDLTIVHEVEPTDLPGSV